MEGCYELQVNSDGERGGWGEAKGLTVMKC